MSWFDDNWGKIGGTLALGPVGFLGGSYLDKTRQNMSAADAARNNFDPYSGQPTEPGYVGMDPNSLKETNQLNTAPMDQFTNEAMRSGPSRAAQLAMKAQNGIALGDRATARAVASGEAATQRTALASKGGMGAGAAERIGTGAASNALDMTQKSMANSANNINNINMGDEQNRVSMLGQAPSMQLSAANYGSGVQGSNIDRQQLDNTKQNAFNANKYQNQMSAWGAGKTADATAKAGKK